MFLRSFFPDAFFAPAYWPKVGLTVGIPQRRLDLVGYIERTITLTGEVNLTVNLTGEVKRIEDLGQQQLFVHTVTG